MKHGFTLVELLVILGIMIAVGAIVFANLGPRRVDTDLVSTTQQIGALLRQAQSDAMAQEADVAWGFYFSNVTSTAPYYALYKTSYSSSNVVGALYRLPSTVAFVTSTLASGATTSITFSSITGTASVSTSIRLYMPKENTAFSSTIRVASSGSVSF